MEQLSITLEHHKHVFKATQDHIASGPSLTEQTVRVSHAGVGAVSVFASDKGGECDEQFTRSVMYFQLQLPTLPLSISWS